MGKLFSLLTVGHLRGMVDKRELHFSNEDYQDILDYLGVRMVELQVLERIYRRKKDLAWAKALSES